MERSIDIGWRLDRLGLSSFHTKLTALVAAGMYFDSFDIYIASAVLGAMIKSGESSLSFNAAFISVTFLGMMLGAMLSGVLGDRYGRKFCYQFNLALYGGASLAGALAPSMVWLIVFRFIMGIGMGAEIVVGYGTLGEFIPARHRGQFGTVLNLIINTSLFLSTFLGWLIIPAYGWRWMFVIVGVGAFVVWFLRKSLPESPRWLIEQGRAEEAETIVRRIEAVSRVQDTDVAPAPARRTTPEPAAFADLFGPALLARTITGIVCLVGLFTVNFAFVSWIPTFLVQQGHSVSNSLGITALMFAGGPLGSLIALALAEPLGRKWGIVVFSLIGIVLGVIYPFATDPTALVVTGFAITACIYVLSSFSVATYVPELFPTAVRLRGAGLCNAVGRAVNIGVPYVVAWSFAGFGIAGVLALICLTLLVQAVVVAWLGPETKRRSLEAIEAEAAA